MNKIKAGIYGMAMFIIIFSLSGCMANKDDSIVIASLNPMTGSSAQFGQMKVMGMKLAIEKINAEGGIRGKKIVLAEYDDKGSPKTAVSLAKVIADDSRILATNAHWNSGCMLATRGTFQAGGMPVITDCANKDVTDGATPAVFRISRSDKVQAKALAEYATNTMKLKKAAIISIGNDFGKSYSEAFVNEFTSNGGSVLMKEVYYEGENKSFSKMLKRIKESKSDMLLVVSYYDDTTTIANEAYEVGLRIQIFGADGVNDRVTHGSCTKCLEGIKFIGFGHPSIEGKGTEEFVQKFKEKYNIEPDSYAMMGYDSIMLIAEAIKERGFSRKEIINYLGTQNSFEGVSGPTVFENNEATRNVVILTVKDGKIVPIK